MKKFCHIVLLLAVVAVAACRGPRVIPRDKLVDIYCDMFMADQQIRANDVSSRELDSLLVYEAVFQKFGYDTDDYMHSLRHYLKDPERFAKVFEEVAARLEGQAKSLDPIIQHQDWVAQRMGAKRPRIDSILAPFSKDSMYVGLARVVRDSSRYPAWFRLVGVRKDTLMAPVDSLKAPADTVVADTVAKDPVAVETPAVEPKAEPVPEKLEDDLPIRGRLRRQQVREQGQAPVMEATVEEEEAE